jgi:hypothetical protein
MKNQSVKRKVFILIKNKMDRMKAIKLSFDRFEKHYQIKAMSEEKLIFKNQINFT